MDEHSARTQETKRERFRRLAKQRTDVALKRIGMLEPLANRAQYGFDASDANLVLRELQQAVERVRTAFYPAPSRESREIDFDDPDRESPIDADF